MCEFTSSVAQLNEIAAKTREQVVYVHQHQLFCREVSEDIQSLSSILRDVEEKYPVLSQATKDTLCRFLPKLKKIYEEGMEFIEAQVKVGSVKKFNTSRSTKYVLDTLGKTLKSSKETLTAALFERLDPSVCSNTIPSTVGIEKHIESMLLAFRSENYLQALHIGKEVLRKVPHDDVRTKAGIHYDMACAYSQLYNAPSAITHLQNSRAFGFSDFKQLDEDRDFDNVRSHLEFMNFRQMMEYEVLQTEQWRELSEPVTRKLAALFNKYDEEGSGTLSFPQFQALCAGAFPSGSAGRAQVLVLWRETCEDSTEAMHLVEFLNYMAEHRNILTRLLPQVKSQLHHYSGHSPIHTSTGFSPNEEFASKGSLRDGQTCTQQFQFSPFSYSVEGHNGGWMGETPQTVPVDNFYQDNFDSANSMLTPFSYYATTDLFNKFRS